MIDFRILRDKRNETARVALSPSEMVAVRGGLSEIVRIQLPGVLDLESWDASIRAGLKTVSESLRHKSGKLEVVLLPPLVELKMARLPRLSATERRDVLSREAEKYFAPGGQSIVVGAIRTNDPAIEGGFRQYAIFAVSDRIVDVVARAANEAGLTLESISPSPLCLAASTIDRVGPSRATILACAYSDRLELTAVSSGTVVAIRRLSRECDTETIRDTIARMIAERRAQDERPEILVVGNSAHPLHSISEAEGSPIDSLRDLMYRADAGSACMVQRTLGRSVDLLPPEISSKRRRARWTRAAQNFAAALLLISVAFGSRVFLACRALQQERAVRAQLASRVAAALPVQDTLRLLQREWILITDGDPKSRNRTQILATLSRALPADAVLRSVRMRGDSVFLVGISGSAEQVLAALRGVPGFSDSRFTAPVEQTATTDDAVTESFAIRITTVIRRPAAESFQLPRAKAGGS
jgi:hypothetical protein